MHTLNIFFRGLPRGVLSRMLPPRKSSIYLPNTLRDPFNNIALIRTPFIRPQPSLPRRCIFSELIDTYQFTRESSFFSQSLHLTLSLGIQTFTKIPPPPQIRDPHKYLIVGGGNLGLLLAARSGFSVFSTYLRAKHVRLHDVEAKTRYQSDLSIISTQEGIDPRVEHLLVFSPTHPSKRFIAKLRETVQRFPNIKVHLFSDGYKPPLSRKFNITTQTVIEAWARKFNMAKDSSLPTEDELGTIHVELTKELNWFVGPCNDSSALDAILLKEMLDQCGYRGVEVKSQKELNLFKWFKYEKSVAKYGPLLMLIKLESELKQRLGASEESLKLEANSLIYSKVLLDSDIMNFLYNASLDIHKRGKSRGLELPNPNTYIYKQIESYLNEAGNHLPTTLQSVIGLRPLDIMFGFLGNLTEAQAQKEFPYLWRLRQIGRKYNTALRNGDLAQLKEERDAKK